MALLCKDGKGTMGRLHALMFGAIAGALVAGCGGGTEPAQEANVAKVSSSAKKSTLDRGADFASITDCFALDGDDAARSVARTYCSSLLEQVVVIPNEPDGCRGDARLGPDEQAEEADGADFCTELVIGMTDELPGTVDYQQVWDLRYTDEIPSDLRHAPIWSPEQGGTTIADGAVLPNECRQALLKSEKVGKAYGYFKDWGQWGTWQYNPGPFGPGWVFRKGVGERPANVYDATGFTSYGLNGDVVKFVVTVTASITQTWCYNMQTVTWAQKPVPHPLVVQWEWVQRPPQGQPAVGLIQDPLPGAIQLGTAAFGTMSWHVEKCPVRLAGATAGAQKVGASGAAFVSNLCLDGADLGVEFKGFRDGTHDVKWTGNTVS